MSIPKALKSIRKFTSSTAPYPQKSYTCMKSRCERSFYDIRNIVAKTNHYVYIYASLTNISDVMSLSIKNIFGEKTKKTLAAAMIAAGMVAPSVAANANEPDGDMTATPVSSSSAKTPTYISRAEMIAAEAAKVKVPFRDQTHSSSKDIVRRVTARTSKDGITVAVYGPDKNLFNEAKLAMWDAHQKGIPVKGIIIGPLNEERGYDVYADGHRWSDWNEEHLQNNSDLRGAVGASIQYAYSGMVLVKKKLADEQSGIKPTAYTPE